LIQNFDVGEDKIFFDDKNKKITKEDVILGDKGLIIIKPEMLILRVETLEGQLFTMDNLILNDDITLPPFSAFLQDDQQCEI